MDPPVSYSRLLRRGIASPKVHKDRYWLHVSLFVVTFASTALTTSLLFIGRSVAWASSDALFNIGGLQISVGMVSDGCLFAGCLLLFLTVHEFGHYFTALRHNVRTSLPYYIPAPLIGIGTMGAVISIREVVPSVRKIFDIGVAGPVAGFLVALPMLLYAMMEAPPPEYMFGVGGHEPLLAYIGAYGSFPPEPLSAPDGTRLTIGTTALYWGLQQLFDGLPPMYEMYHYPILFAAWLGLFFTALNLMPVGQLDGGHIMYALVGPKWALRVSQGFVVLLLTSAAIGAARDGPGLIATALPRLGAWPLVQELCTWVAIAVVLRILLRRVFRSAPRWALPMAGGILMIAVLGRLVDSPIAQIGYSGWIVWCFLLVFLIRVEHPPVATYGVLTHGRRLLGITAMVIFLLCFSFKPLYLV